MNERAKIDFAALIGPVARILWGEPTDETSTEHRWGRNGSKSVNLSRGAWFDHESSTGGGVLDLIKREVGLSGRDAIRWLAEQGFGVDAPRRIRKLRERATLVKTWDYPAFQVCRMEYPLKAGESKPRKTFRQRRPDGNGR